MLKLSWNPKIHAGGRYRRQNCSPRSSWKQVFTLTTQLLSPCNLPGKSAKKLCGQVRKMAGPATYSTGLSASSSHPSWASCTSASPDRIILHCRLFTQGGCYRLYLCIKGGQHTWGHRLLNRPHTPELHVFCKMPLKTGRLPVPGLLRFSSAVLPSPAPASVQGLS